MSQENQLKWHEHSPTVALLLFFVWPVGLFLMWKNKIWTIAVRCVITFILLAMVYSALLWRYQ
jgi:hypothetical protein